MEKTKNIIKSFLLCITILLGQLTTVAYAASPFTVTVKNNGNGTMTVTVSGKVVGGFNVTAGSKKSQLAIRNIGGSDSTTLNTGAGTFTVKVTAISISDANYNVTENYTLSKKVTVTKKTTETTKKPTTTTPSKSTSTKKTTTKTNTTDKNTAKKTTIQTAPKSTENRLKTLTVEGASLSPKFSENTTSYSATVTDDISSVTIKATAKDSKAKVTGIGKKDVTLGENNFMVTVTSESGAKKTYTISIIVEEKIKTSIDYNGKKLGVIENYSKIDIPKGFKLSDVQYDETSIKGLKNEDSGITLLSLNDEDNKMAFYIYENNRIIAEYQTIEVLGQEYVIYPMSDNTVSDMTETTLQIGNKNIKAWEHPQDGDMLIVSLISEKGNKDYYLYDKKEGTIQRYVKIEPIIDTVKIDEQEQTIRYLTMGCLSLLIAFAGSQIYYRRKNKKQAKKA